MMNLHKVMIYVLRVYADLRSEASRNKLLEVLSSVSVSETSINLDPETGIIHITDSLDIDLVLHTLAKSGYRVKLVRTISPAVGLLHPTFYRQRRPQPGNVAYDDSSYVGDYYGYGLSRGQQDSQISYTDRYEGALHYPLHTNHCHRPLPPCHQDNRLECTHHHHCCHGRNVCALRHQHGINHCRHDNRYHEGIGCANHHQCHGGYGCALHHHHHCRH
ncbi:uncharacterized protein LOC141705353 [Apium graveolens]|uniref:uncharacterized protein LOC141705353 n=1 Tax=Apium graveolens TaxID=4045 RepID=UPI003D7A45E9